MLRADSADNRTVGVGAKKTPALQPYHSADVDLLTGLGGKEQIERC